MMLVRALFSTTFSWAMSRSSFRVLERMRELHFLTWRGILVGIAGRCWRWWTNLGLGVWLEEDGFDGLHVGYLGLFAETMLCHEKLILEGFSWV